MHHHEIHLRDSHVVLAARKKYSTLISLSDESIEARYHLLEYLFREYGYRGLLSKNEKGIPTALDIGGKSYYWSLSHTEKHVAFSVSDISTGIDIVEITERDISLFIYHADTEYSILGRKDWVTFSILWSLKESLIKKLALTLDDMQYIVLSKKTSSDTYILQFSQKSYILFLTVTDTTILSYTLS